MKKHHIAKRLALTSATIKPLQDQHIGGAAFFPVEPGPLRTAAETCWSAGPDHTKETCGWFCYISR
jgi:hypothetical protein